MFRNSNRKKNQVVYLGKLGANFSFYVIGGPLYCIAELRWASIVPPGWFPLIPTYIHSAEDAKLTQVWFILLNIYF